MIIALSSGNFCCEPWNTELRERHYNIFSILSYLLYISISGKPLPVTINVQTHIEVSGIACKYISTTSRGNCRNLLYFQEHNDEAIVSFELTITDIIKDAPMTRSVFLIQLCLTIEVM